MEVLPVDIPSVALANQLPRRHQPIRCTAKHNNSIRAKTVEALPWLAAGVPLVPTAWVAPLPLLDLDLDQAQR